MTETEKQEQIINKIKRALDYGNKTTHKDSEAALAAAMRLAAKHNIDIQDVINKSVDPLSNYKNVDGIKYGKRIPTEFIYIAAILREFFNIDTVDCPCGRRGSGESKVAFIGTTENVEIAKYVYNQLYVQFKYLFEVAKVVHKLKTTDKRNYYNGLFGGFYAKLKSEQKNIESELSLVIVKDPKIQQAREAFFPNTKSKAIAKIDNNEEVRTKGFSDSEKININKAVSGKSNSDSHRFLIGE